MRASSNREPDLNFTSHEDCTTSSIYMRDFMFECSSQKHLHVFTKLDQQGEGYWPNLVLDVPALHVKMLSEGRYIQTLRTQS